MQIWFCFFFFLTCLAIREEIEEIKEGKYDTANNVLKVWCTFLEVTAELVVLSLFAAVECSPHYETDHGLRVEPSLLQGEGCFPSGE